VTDSVWRAATIAPTDSLIVGPMRWTGLLLHEGPLRLIGDVALQGVLIVRGTLDARAARLRVRGGVLLDDPATPSMLGPAELQWDRCAVEMALSTLAEPRSTPFRVWHTVTR
jgi:hypothetical protein